jgi:hypothetical protein
VNGRLRRLRGQARGLLLPSDIEEAVKLAREAGFLVLDALPAGLAPYGAIPMTFSSLPQMPVLDQLAENQ